MVVLAASSDVLVFLAAAVAVALLLFYQMRLQKRFDQAAHDLRRLEKAQKEAALDARRRLEEGERAIEDVEGRVLPKLADAGRTVEEMGGRMTALEARLEAGHPSFEAFVARSEEALAGLREKLADLEAQIHEARGTSAETRTEVERLGGALGDRMDALDRRIRAVRDAGGATRAPRAAAAPIEEGPGDEALPTRETRPAPEPGSGTDAEPASPSGEDALPALPVEKGALVPEETGPPEEEAESRGMGGVQVVLIWLAVLAALAMLIDWVSRAS